MKPYPEPLEMSRVRVRPLSDRESLSRLEKVLVDPASEPANLPGPVEEQVHDCAWRIRAARERGASVMLIYGAHLIKNGGMSVVNALLEQGWVTHVATNGAGTIHDWEFSYFGRTEESVRQNVARGCFGTWEETGRTIHLALLAGALRGEGYGRSLGRLIEENGATLPSPGELASSIRNEPGHPLTAARADALHAIQQGYVKPGRNVVNHQHPRTSLLAEAFRRNVPFSVHPGIGYDIFATHPMFNGAVIGRAGAMDFALFSRAVEGLDGGVVMSVGSAIMAPQVFEKSISCVNNLRLQEGRAIVAGHTIYVVDIQDGGNWDWAEGEPPKTNPAYYLRFCKSFARMGGEMKYAQADNVTFLHSVLRELDPA